MFRALIPGTDFAPQTACRQPLPTGTARKQTAPQNHDTHQKTIHTHAFTGASRRIRRLRGVQFGRRRPRTAETLRLRHLHGGLHHARIEGRRNGLEKRAAALHLDQRHERRLGTFFCSSRNLKVICASTIFCIFVKDRLNSYNCVKNIWSCITLK